MKPIKNILTIDRVAQEVAERGANELKWWSRYDYFETSDGYRIMLTPTRAKSITTTIWESDEDEHGNYITGDDIAPTEDARKRLFFAENMRNLDDITAKAENSHRTLYISKPTRTSDTLRTVYARGDNEVNDFHDVERPLTEPEIADLKKWEEEQRQLMAERLERYWKRYKNKVRVDTYWVNR